MHHSKGLTLIAALTLIVLSGCATVFPAPRPKGSLVLPTKIDQAAWTPKASQQTYYHNQSLLYAEFGSRFFTRGDAASARKFFELSLKYDEANSKSLFGLAMTDWQEGRYPESVRGLSLIRPVEKKTYPYDIDYYTAAKMLLDSLPLTGKVIALSRSDRITAAENVIVVNRGSNNGLRVGMGFDVLRVGNPIRDFESMTTLGVQRTNIAHVTVTEVAEKNAICKVDSILPEYFIQVNDIIESNFGGSK
jgi:hypothetical protein